MANMEASVAPRIESTNWSALGTGERIRYLEMEGYVVIPDLLSPQQVAELRRETARLETRPMAYSDKQRSCKDAHWHSRVIAELIARQPTIAFLRELFGDEIVFMGCVYARSEPGHPGVILHTDGQPYGSKIFGYEGSCPISVRVLYYLQDLTPDVSPFRIVPRSHLSMHVDGNPYKRYASHPEETIVTCRAGSAVLLNHRCFHGNGPNQGNRVRELLAVLYRPAWAGPIASIEPWDEQRVAALPSHVREFFIDPSRRDFAFDQADRPADAASDAPGIAPSRWLRE